jgi:AraC-like DNA-binding protein
MTAPNTSRWNGSIFLWSKRVIFVGEAGTSEDQTVHAIKICVALSGDFELSVNSEAEGKRYSAVIINAGITHTVKCDGAKIFLLYLLPETEEARALRWEYLNNGKGGVYDIPRELIEESLPLTQILENYSTQDCQKVSRICDEVLRGLGQIRRRQLSTSTDLTAELSENVRRAVEHIYAKMDEQVKSQRFDEKQFTDAAIARALGLSETEARRLKGQFREDTGIPTGRFFRDIQLLAALRLYAVNERSRQARERELLAELERPNLGEEEREEIGRTLEETSKGIFLKHIAESLGFRTLDKFDHRIKSRLGISLSDLKGNSSFFDCGGPPVD